MHVKNKEETTKLTKDLEHQMKNLHSFVGNKLQKMALQFEMRILYYLDWYHPSQFTKYTQVNI